MNAVNGTPSLPTGRQGQETMVRGQGTRGKDSGSGDKGQGTGDPPPLMLRRLKFCDFSTLGRAWSSALRRAGSHLLGDTHFPIRTALTQGIPLVSPVFRNSMLPGLVTVHYVHRPNLHEDFTLGA